MEFYEFLKGATAQPDGVTLGSLVGSMLDQGRGTTLYTMSGRNLWTIPNRATNLNFGAEGQLAELTAQYAKVQVWTPAEATAEAELDYQRGDKLIADGIATNGPMLEVTLRLIKAVSNWHPTSDDQDVIVQLELFRARLLVWLYDAKAWVEHRSQGWQPSKRTKDGEEYRDWQLTKLSEEILKNRLQITEMYAQAARELPFLQALRDQLPTIMAPIPA